MATFSDLMNLLLCFFVLLFSMSSVDANKWEEVVASMTSAFSVFEDGSTTIGEGTLVGMGTTQLSNLDEYYASLGQKSEDNGEDMRDKPGDNDKGPDDQKNEGKTPDDSQGEGKKDDVEIGEGKLQEALEAANYKETTEMVDAISEMTERYNISGLMEVGMDVNGKYVELTISGSVLFESGSAELKKECLPLLSKVGDILKVYSGNNVQVIGHTDNIPMKSQTYSSNDILSSARAISVSQYLINEKGVSVEHISWTGRGEYDPIDTNATAEGRARNRRVEIRIYNSLSS
ncbi:MAG: OmpA family protein [Lachnospiraceae bacterium]|nr:OmpA family protein [Lachnospiraceae bacterium]